MEVKYRIRCIKDVIMSHNKQKAFNNGNNYIMVANNKGDKDPYSFEATNDIGQKNHIVLKAKIDTKDIIIEYTELGKWFNEHFIIIEKYSKATEKYVCECGFDLRDRGLYYNVDSTLEFNEETCKFEISLQAPELTCSNCDRYTSLTKEDLALC